MLRGKLFQLSLLLQQGGKITMSRRLLIAFVISTVLVLYLTSIAFSAATYHWNAAQAPTMGNHWWYNNDPNPLYAKWIVDDLWSSSNRTELVAGNWMGVQYHLENEAYKPPSSYCDRLHVNNVTIISLPITGWGIANGCGGTSVLEEVKVHLHEPSVAANTYYRHIVQYHKSACNVYPNEVNYTFSNQFGSDDWLGKVYLDSTCNRIFPSDPPGLIN
jgi:hypothetical protein